MDRLLRQLDTIQEFLYNVEDFLENCKDNEVVEFLSDYWKECLLGSIGTYLVVSYSSNYLTVNTYFLGLTKTKKCS